MTIETKYDIGDKVWYIDTPNQHNVNEPVEMEIEEIQFNKHEGVVYKMKHNPTKIVGRFRNEKTVFPTKESLLASL